MKKSKVLLVIIVIGLLSVFGYAYSTTQNKLWETKKVATTAKVWGFLKYYHPEVNKGSFNWDQQLFDILPKVEEAGNKEELSQVYLEWINSLGEVEKVNIQDTISEERYFNKNFNLQWTQNTNIFTEELCKQLKFIEENRCQGNHYYVGFTFGVGNIKLKNELDYSHQDWSQKENRLLSLFRYWNIIEYFFPYKYQMDQNWDEALLEMIPKIADAATEQDFHLALLEMIVKINDSHARFTTMLTKEFFGMKWLPAKFKIVEDKAIITDFLDENLARKDDIRKGDIISRVNGKEIAKILKEKDKYINGSNASVKKRNALYAIFNGATDSVEIEFERNKEIKTKTVHRYLYRTFKTVMPDHKKWEVLDNNIGYVNMGILQRADVKQMMESLMNTKAIVFDIRNYPKGTMYDISNYLNAEPQEFVKFTVPSLKYPGKFLWTQNLKCGGKEGPKYRGQVVILVNETTQSHAEFTTMCLQTAHNAVVIGSQTSGADGNVSRISIPGGFTTGITGIGVFYPDGRETQRIGIVPDIEVKPTLLGLQAGKDEVLEKAIEVIQNNGETVVVRK